MSRIIRTYSELQRLETFEERFNYLNLSGKVGADIWGAERFLNQSFYKSYEWKRARREVVARDSGFDLGVEGIEIPGYVIVHHMTPITIEDIDTWSPFLTDPKYLVAVSLETHNAIHYGKLNKQDPIVRTRNDHILW